LVAARLTLKRRLEPVPGRQGDFRRAVLCLLAAGVALAGCGTQSASSPPAPKRIALVYRARGGAIVLASARGADPRTLGRAAQALLAPDGTRVLALSHGGGTATLTLYRTGRTGRTGEPRRLATLGAPSFSSTGVQLLAWSPDSRYVALSADALSGGGEEGALLLLNVASGQLRTIATGNFLGASFAPTLPDRLVYSNASIGQLDDNESLLYMSDLSGRHTRELTSSGLASSPAWTARGILFARLLSLGGPSSSPRYGLWLIRPDGRGLRRIGDLAFGPPVLADGAAISVSAGGGRAVGDFYSAYSARPLVDIWEIGIAARSSSASVIRLPGIRAVAKGISRGGKEILVVAQSSGSTAVESIPWSRGETATLASAGTDPSWNH
jgi:hypothetical protein